MTDQELIAAFLARKGVTKVAPGARTYTDRQLYAARTETVKLGSKAAALAERRIVVGRDGVEHCQNGLGEWIY